MPRAHPGAQRLRCILDDHDAVWQDGANAGGTSAGAGTAILNPQPSTILLGASNASIIFDGFVKGFKVCKAKSAKDCK